MENRGLGQIAILIIIGIAIALFGMAGGPERFLNGAGMKMPKPADNFYVYDTGHAIGDDTENYMVSMNQNMQKQCGAEVVTVCVTTVGRSDIKDYARAMFNQWGVGDRNRNNGVLILAAISDENYYILPGEGLKDVFTDSEIKKIMESSVEPEFAKGNYEAALAGAFNAVVNKLEKNYNITVTADEPESVWAYKSGGQAGNAEMITRMEITEFGSYAIKIAEDILKIAIIAGLFIGLFVVFGFMIADKIKARKNSFAGSAEVSM